MDTEASPAPRRFLVGRRTFRVVGAGVGDLYFRQIRGRFEPEFQAICARALGPGAVGVDVGANIGATALMMDAYAGGGGRVIAVEPGPQSFALLQRNLALNEASTVTALNCAVSAEPGLMTFCENSAYGHLTQGAEGPQVEVQTLDQIVENQGLTRLDLLKIDTEGFEPQVLEGARATLERLRPVIYLERVEGPPDEIAAVLLSDNLAYFHALNDLVLLPDEAAVARFSDMIVPRIPPVPTGPLRLVKAVAGRLARP